MLADDTFIGDQDTHMSMMKPRAPLTIEVQIIARGRILDEFLISSAMCTAASAPKNAVVGVNKPTKQASPAVEDSVESNGTV